MKNYEHKIVSRRFFFQLKRFTHVSLVSALTFCALFFNVACDSTKPPARTSTASHSYPMKGKVISIDKAKRRVNVEHQEILKPEGGVYMEAMTMGFALRDMELYDELKAGDEIQATLVIEQGRSLLDNVTFSRLMSGYDAGTSNAASVIDPQPGTRLPDFTLVNQDNKKIQLDDYRNQVLLLTFIYTRCPLPDYCPLMSDNFVAVNKIINDNPNLRARVRLLSITFDPKYDTPAVLRDYARRYVGNNDEAFKRWDFATGTPEQIAAIARFFGLTYETAQDETINHSLTTAVVAPDGKLLKLYRGNDWQPAELAREAERYLIQNPSTQGARL